MQIRRWVPLLPYVMPVLQTPQVEAAAASVRAVAARPRAHPARVAARATLRQVAWVDRVLCQVVLNLKGLFLHSLGGLALRAQPLAALQHQDRRQGLLNVLHAEGGAGARLALGVGNDGLTNARSR